MPSAVLSEAERKAKENTKGDANPDVQGYKARRYAVKFSPPCIFLEYEDTSKKRRVRAVKLNGVQATVDPDRLTRKVIRSFPRKLEPSSVKYDQVRKLVVKLLEYLANSGDDAAASDQRQQQPQRDAKGAAPGSGSPGAPRPEQGGPRGPSPLGPMRVSANGDSQSPGAPLPLPSVSPRPGGAVGRLTGGAGGGGGQGHYRGSVESNLSRFSTSTGASRSDEEAEEDDEFATALDELNREMDSLGGSSTPYGSRSVASTPAGATPTRHTPPGAAAAPAAAGSTQPTPAAASSEESSRDSSFSFRDRPTGLGGGTAAGGGGNAGGGSPASGAARANGAGGAGEAAGPRSRFAAEAEKLTIGLTVTDDMDLNKVTDVELKAAKAAMEEDFKRHQLRPGDPGYEYDRQLEFAPPTEKNEWDDSSDEEEEEEEEAQASEDAEVDWADIQAAVSRPSQGAMCTPSATPRGRASTPGAGAGAGASGRGPSCDGSSAPHRDGVNGKADSPYNSNDWP